MNAFITLLLLLVGRSIFASLLVAPQVDVVVELKSISPVIISDSRIYLSDLFECVRGDMCEELASVDLGAGPSPGQWSSFNTDSLMGTLKDEGYRLRLNLSGPRRIRVRNPGQRIDEEKVVEDLRQQLVEKDSLQHKIDIDKISIIGQRLQNAGSYTYTLLDVDTFVGDVLNKRKIFHKVAIIAFNETAGMSSVLRATLRSVLTMKILITNSIVKKNERFTKKNSLLKWRRVQGREKLVNDFSEAKGKVSARALPAGRKILKSDFMLPRVIERGDSVKVAIVKNNITVTGLGTAMGSGARGEVIPVKLKGQKSHLQMTVIDAGSGRVML